MVIAAQHAGSDGMSPGAVEVQQMSVLAWSQISSHTAARVGRVAVTHIIS